MNKLFAFMSFTFIAMTMLSFAIEGQVGLAATRLSSPLDSEDTIAYVTTTDGFIDSDIMMIEGEILYYTGKTETSFTGLTRGYRDTDIQTHKTSEKVFNEPTGLINQAVGFNIVEMMSRDGPIKVMWNLPGALVSFFAKLVMWDFSFLEGNLMGFPLAYIKFLVLYPISAGFVIQGVQILTGVFRISRIL